MKPRPKRKPREEDKEKSRHRWVLWGSLLMVGLMVFSFAEIVMNGSNSGATQTKYGKYDFTIKQYPNQGSVWVTQINGQEVEFQNLPVNVGYLDVDPAAIALIQSGQQVVLSSDTNASQLDASTVDYAKLELSLAIPKTVSAILAPDERYTLPVINCSRASPQTPVVVFNISNDTNVKAYGDCIVVNGEQGDILRLKDRIIFEYYGMLNNGTLP